MFGAARDVVQKCVLWMEINTFYANLAAEDFGRGAHRTWASLFFMLVGFLVLLGNSSVQLLDKGVFYGKVCFLSLQRKLEYEELESILLNNILYG